MTFSTSKPRTLRILGGNGTWSAAPLGAGLGLPGVLTVDGGVVLQEAVCRCGRASDQAAALSGWRRSTKGGASAVVSEGELVGAPGVVVTHHGRFGPAFVRVTTDLKLPRGAVVAEGVAIGSVLLPGPWQSWRIVTLGTGTGLALGTEQAVPATAAVLGEWAAPPLAVFLSRPDGLVLEVGVGGDLWRWEQGLGEPDHRGFYQLATTPEGIRFERWVSRWGGEQAPVPRTYRFSWYLAWGREQPVVVPAVARPASFLATGDLDVARVAAEQREHPGAALQLDVAALPLSAGARRRRAAGDADAAAAPCFEADHVRSGLNRVVRQLVALPDQDFPIVFRHLSPGGCANGRHTGKPGRTVVHWDLPALLEFGLWARRQFGPERQLVREAADPFFWPSLHYLLAAGEPRHEFAATVQGP